MTWDEWLDEVPPRNAPAPSPVGDGPAKVRLTAACDLSCSAPSSASNIRSCRECRVLMSPVRGSVEPGRPVRDRG